MGFECWLRQAAAYRAVTSIELIARPSYQLRSCLTMVDNAANVRCLLSTGTP